MIGRAWKRVILLISRSGELVFWLVFFLFFLICTSTLQFHLELSSGSEVFSELSHRLLSVVKGSPQK